MRTQRGERPIAPDPARGHGEDLLRMIRGGEVTRAEADAMEAYLRTVSDHGLNASTFTARVVASTGASLAAACVAGIGALEGPLHGGAPGPVLDMLDAIGTAAQAEAWLEAELLAGRRIMGMGHRIYRVRDPRAAVLERAIERLVADGAVTERLDLARAVERAARAALRERYPQRTLDTNVEFYTAVLLDAVGLSRELFAATFANGRLLGWGRARRRAAPRRPPRAAAVGLRRPARREPRGAHAGVIRYRNQAQRF
jgi:citrate synthase